MKTRAEIGRFQSSIGSTNVTNQKYLVSDDDTVETYPNTDDSEDENDSEEDENDDVGYNPDESNVLLDEIYMKSLSGEIDLDEVMTSATHAGKPKGINPTHLSKVWKISHEQAVNTIDATTQHSQQTDDPKLSRNYGSND